MANGRNLTITGDLSAEEDITVDFAIDGSVALPGRNLVVTEDGHLHATVTAGSVTVRGHVDGHISAERLEIASSGVVNAGVVAAKLSLHDGAQFTGPVNTDRAKAAVTVAKHRQKA
jgi:cytoskeletal protein CcmA (bactofilin family)